MPLLVEAQSTDETYANTDWPEEIEYKPYTQAPAYMKPSDNPVVKRYQQLEEKDRQQAEAQKAIKPIEGQGVVPEMKSRRTKKEGIWPFSKEKVLPLSEEQVTQVGPRQTFAAQEPLLALPVALELNGQSLPSGFYLVKQEVIDENTRRWLLVRENKILFNCMATKSIETSTIADSPLTPINPLAASVLSPVMKVVISPFNANMPQTAILTLQENGQHYNSQTFLISQDSLPKLRSE